MTRHFAICTSRLHLLAGARILPKFWVGMVEGLAGLGIPIGSSDIDLSLVIFWGRKSTYIGDIYSTGVGARVAFWWRFLERKKYSMRLGPAAELVGLGGYGNETSTSTSHTAVSPALDFSLFIGSSLALTQRVDLHFAIGAGWTAVHFYLKADGKTVSGMAGATAEALIGVDFGI